MADLTITLKGATAEQLRRLMVEERYEHAEDALKDALDALDAARAPEIDTWLRETVAARADALTADSSRALSPEQVREAVFGKA